MNCYYNCYIAPFCLHHHHDRIVLRESFLALLDQQLPNVMDLPLQPNECFYLLLDLDAQYTFPNDI